MTGEHDTTRYKRMENNSQHRTSPEDGLLLGRNALSEKKIVRVRWETLYCLHAVNMHGTENIKIAVVRLFQKPS